MQSEEQYTSGHQHGEEMVELECKRQGVDDDSLPFGVICVISL